jgi:hypothetical protein
LAVLADVLLVATKENGLNTTADKTKFMHMSPEENEGRNHKLKLDKIIL